jgi:DNA replication protein DnaC
MKYLVENSNIPSARWKNVQLIPGGDIEAFFRLNEIKSHIEEWVKNGYNLYIYSDKFGNGKTSWSIKLMLSFFDRVWPGNAFRRRGLFVSVPEFLDRNREILNNRDNEFVQIRQDLIDCDLVIWDDITSVKLTDFQHSLLMNYIDARILAGKSNIFTGNVSEKKMSEFVGGRLSSRICNGSEVVQFNDEDKRGLGNIGRVASFKQSSKRTKY